MASSPDIQLFVSLISKELDIEERDREYLRLFSELKHNPDIETVNRVPLTHHTETHHTEVNENFVKKGVVSFISGVMTAEITAENIRSVFCALYGRLSNHTIELEVASQDRKLKVSAHSQADLEAAIAQATAFVSQGVAK